MLYKNLPWYSACWIIPVRLQLDGIAAWKHLFKGDGGFFLAIVKAHVHFVKWIFVGKYTRIAGKSKGEKFPGMYHGTIAWDHFVNKKNSFLEIIGGK